MLLDELLEIVGEYLAGEPARPRIDRNLRHLQQQALLQVAGADARGLQFVKDTQQPFEFLGRSFDTHRKGDVVGHRLQVAAQVTVLVDTSDEVYRQAHVALREVAEAQLLDQVFGQRAALSKEYGALLVVFRIVIDTAFVRRGVVLAQVLVDGDLLGLFFIFRCMFLFLQHDVVLDLLFDALFELHGGELQQFDHLNLLGRELLLKR